MSPTPSGFHDSAYRRDAGHDIMQQRFLEWLRSRPVVALINSATAIVHRHVEGEYALYRRGEIVAYADAVEIMTVGFVTTVNLFEIKPKIHTVFGIVRQAKKLEDLARSTPADFHLCHVVVPHDDPLLADLRKEWPRVWAWGISFEPVECADD